MDEQHLGALRRAIETTVAPNATTVDRDGTFPQAGIDALSEAGVLGLTISPEHGGGGGTIADVAAVVEQLATECGSTAMVVLMHFAASALIESHGPAESREAIASGKHLTTLAFSEAGSRSHFWAPRSTATAKDGGVQLDAKKSWVTSAAHADSYVWSSTPVGAEAPMTLWHVPRATDGISVAGSFDGLGLRGNGSTPVTAEGAVIPESAMIGEDGAGLDIALGAILPTFLVGNAAFSLGLMEAAVAGAAAHLTGTRLEHLDETMAQQLLPRTDLARMRIRTDMVRGLLNDTLQALAEGRPDAMLRVLESKAAASEAALEVTELAMKVCGGSAFRKEVGVERRFRDARAARVMAPTTDALHDFIGRAITGQELFG